MLESPVNSTEYPGPQWRRFLLQSGHWERLRRLRVWLVQATLFVAAGAISFLLRFDLTIPRSHIHYLYYGLLVWVITKLLVFHLFGLDHGWWRFVSARDAIWLVLGNLAASLLSAAIILLVSPHGFPRSIYFLDFLLTLLGTAGIRITARLIFDIALNAQSATARRALIYGAGQAGITLLREIRANPALNLHPCGLIDDDFSKHGLRIQGVRVLGPGSRLADWVQRYRASEVLIALPSASRSQMNEVLSACERVKVRCRIIPALGDVVQGKGLASSIRDVAVEDLLGRKPVRLDQTALFASLQGKIVLVTGAAGSIGSELCCQLARFSPAAIIGFEVAETPLFHLELKMQRLFPATPFYPVIGNVQSRSRVEEVMSHYKPEVVYHAAAFKHVPMMEAHVFEAVENNVLGTLNVAQAAERHHVRQFVMISTDKAVNPTNIMGTTKRVAELVVRSLQGTTTQFISVRFGNVLGSNGSVVPRFKEQIAQGGPVTVTHPDMQRYFMTIPEACQLVLQSATMGKGGEIFVLDMGEPVRIMDLARTLITLSGYRPDEDIKIEFSGIRPGEKLFEEINTADEQMRPTSHEKIRIFSGSHLTRSEVDSLVHELRQASDDRDLTGLLRVLRQIVPEYTPDSHLLQRVEGSVLKKPHAVSSGA